MSTDQEPQLPPISLPDAVAERILPDGRRLAVLPLLFGQARLGLGRVVTPTGEPEDGFTDIWDYPSVIAAELAMERYDPDHEAEPAGWHRHPASGRRRPNGDASKEYVSR